MSPLRLGAYQLPAAEVVLVQTLFRLYAHSGQFRWRFVTEGPYDALLADGSTEAGQSPAVDQMAPAVLRLRRMNTPSAPNTLERPIRADKLLNWLLSVEQALSPAAAPAASASAAPASDESPQAAPPAPAQAPEAHAPAAAPAAAPAQAPARAPAETAAPAAAMPRYRLRRWPPAAMLRADARRIRMATLLSRRAFNDQELALASQQPLADAQAFLRVLHTTGLVQAEQAAPAQPAQPAPQQAAAAPAPAAARPSFARSLISGIRRRLGL